MNYLKIFTLSMVLWVSGYALSSPEMSMASISIQFYTPGSTKDTTAYSAISLAPTPANGNVLKGNLPPALDLKNGPVSPYQVYAAVPDGTTLTFAFTATIGVCAFQPVSLPIFSNGAVVTSDNFAYSNPQPGGGYLCDCRYAVTSPTGSNTASVTVYCTD